METLSRLEVRWMGLVLAAASRVQLVLGRCGRSRPTQSSWTPGPSGDPAATSAGAHSETKRGTDLLPCFAWGDELTGGNLPYLCSGRVATPYINRAEVSAVCLSSCAPLNYPCSLFGCVLALAHFCIGKGGQNKEARGPGLRTGAPPHEMGGGRALGEADDATLQALDQV